MKISEIQSVFRQKSSYGDKWKVVIQTDRVFTNRVCKLDWGLTEEECIWLVEKIKNWLASAANLKL